MKRNRLPVLLLLCASVGPLSACATPVTYSAEAIEARVVDAETKQPIEGAVVVAHWTSEKAANIAVTRAETLKVMETITDKDGKFSFPSWGPIRHWKDSRLTTMDPEIVVFKSGYEYRRLDNYDPRLRRRTGKYVSDPEVQEIIALEEGRASHRYSEWNGKTIEMKKFIGTPKERLKMLEQSIPGFGHRNDYKQSILLKAILSEEGSIPDSIEDKQLFFNKIVCRLLDGK